MLKFLLLLWVYLMESLRRRESFEKLKNGPRVIAGTPKFEDHDALGGGMVEEVLSQCFSAHGSVTALDGLCCDSGEPIPHSAGRNQVVQGTKAVRGPHPIVNMRMTGPAC